MDIETTGTRLREEIMTARVAQRSAAEATLNRQFEAETALASSLRRAHAFRRFAERGLPTRRVESWHYTDLRAALREAAPLAPAPDPSMIETARQILATRRRLAAWRLVLLNGRVIAELCEPLPPGSSIARDEPPPADVDDPMVALNEAMSVDAHALAVADGATIEGPIEIVHLAIAEDARSLYSRFAISLGVGASASFVETFMGAGHGAQRNSSTILSLQRARRPNTLWSSKITRSCILRARLLSLQRGRSSTPLRLSPGPP